MCSCERCFSRVSKSTAFGRFQDAECEASNFRYVPLFNWISKFAQAIMKTWCRIVLPFPAQKIKEKKENSREAERIIEYSKSISTRAETILKKSPFLFSATTKKTLPVTMAPIKPWCTTQKRNKSYFLPILTLLIHTNLT